METPKFFETNYFAGQFPPEKPTDHFAVEDLLNLPDDDDPAPVDPSSFAAVAKAAEEPYLQVVGAVDHFSDELCVPYDAELEWLSTFADESFSSEDLQKLHLIQGMNAQPEYHFQPEPAGSEERVKSGPAKAARSKRSRAARASWTSNLLTVSPTAAAHAPAVSSSSESDITATAAKKSPKARKDGSSNSNNSSGGGGGEGRRCLHCATDKTPQWRTGPRGPKTLCNACGVRFKSGRLVPEYRPAASPTFVLTKHSNSHRKVMELRRQKEMQQQHQQQHQHQQQFMHHHHQSMIFDVSNGDDYLIHQHIGPDFRQLI